MSVLYQVSAGVAEIALNRPEKRNALSRDLVAALREALERSEEDGAAQVVLLRGNGPSFCAGGDIADFAKLKDCPAADLYAAGQEDADLFKLHTRLKKPRIAAVHGHAIGGGLGLVALCHVVVAAESAEFGATEINLGLFPFNIAPLLIAAVGRRAALELALTGRRFGALEAQRLGLVQHLAPTETLLDQARMLAQTMAGRSPLALRLGMEAFCVGPEPDFVTMNALRTIVFGSEDLHEGASAFLEQRPPRWRGR